MPLLVRLPFRPVQGALLLKKRPRWLVPFLLVAAASVVLFALRYPDTLRAAMDHLPPSADAGEKERVSDLLHGQLVQRCLFLPFRLFGGWCAFAFALFLSSKAFRPPEGVRFTQFLALEIHAETILALSSLATTLRIPLPGATWMFSSSQDFLLGTLLTTINLITLWYILVLTAGVSVLCGYSKRKAFLIVAGVWAISVFFNLGVLNLLSQSFHFAV